MFGARCATHFRTVDELPGYHPVARMRLAAYRLRQMRAITFDSTRQHAFRLLLAAVGVSAVGSRVTRTALPMAAILLLDATPL
jgi:hypothetical protein